MKPNRLVTLYNKDGTRTVLASIISILIGLLLEGKSIPKGGEMLIEKAPALPIHSIRKVISHIIGVHLLLLRVNLIIAMYHDPAKFLFP